jgi:hypothetical protein
MQGDKKRCGALTKSSSPWNGRLEISVPAFEQPKNTEDAAHVTRRARNTVLFCLETIPGPVEH